MKQFLEQDMFGYNVQLHTMRKGGTVKSGPGICMTYILYITVFVFLVSKSIVLITNGDDKFKSVDVYGDQDNDQKASAKINDIPLVVLEFNIN